MKSIYGFLLFETAVVLYISNVHVIAEEFDCDLDIRIPEAVTKACPQLGKDTELKMGHYMSEATQAVHRKIYYTCKSSVERICDALPEIVVTSNVGGREQCKSDLKEIVCDKNPRYHFKGTADNYLCPYYQAVSTISANSDKWNKLEGEQENICALFKGNHIICRMATKRLCDRINSALVRENCQKILERDICDWEW